MFLESFKEQIRVAYQNELIKKKEEEENADLLIITL
jgi:hypothetical protein